MSFFPSLSNLRSLAPVGFVGACVAITIKLLTAATPINSELLQVKADEDIMKVEEHQEELIEEEEEKASSEEETPAQDEVAAAEEDNQEEEVASGDGAQEEEESEEKKPQGQEEQPKSERRTFKGSGPVIDIFKQLLAPEE